MPGKKATHSSKQGRGMLRNKGQKFAADTIKTQALLMRLLDKATASKKTELADILSIIRLHKDVVSEVWPYIYPKLQAIAHGADSEIAEELLKAIRDIGEAPDQEEKAKD